MAYQTIDPFTEDLIETFPSHSDQQIEQALAAADSAFRSEWGQGPITARAAVLKRLSEILIDRREEFAAAMTLEMGKLIAQGRQEIDVCAAIAAYYAENAANMLKPVPYPTAGGDAWVEHHPIGVLVAIEPWNFPIYQLMRVVVPAIAVGNSVLMKQASNVPKCAALFEQAVREAGAPEGVCVNLYISNEQVSTLIGDDRVQGVALTGSERAGAVVGARASQTLKKSTLELGGSDVFIVLDDADIDRAAATAAAARLYNAGQMCTAAKRFVVHEKIADRFTELFSKHLQNVTFGDPRDESTTLAPLSSRTARDGLARQVEAAVKNGATLVFGGKAPDRKGFFFEPTLLTGLTPANPAYYEEFFGPVAQLYVVKSDDDAVALANDSHFGLGSTVFSGDVGRAKKLAARIEAGMVYINTWARSSPELPFGGVKRSGYGRELSDLGLLEFVNRKLVLVGAE